MTHDSVGVAVAQFAPAASKQTNLDAIGDLARTAAARGARVIVFPEYSSYFVDPFDTSLRERRRPGRSVHERTPGPRRRVGRRARRGARGAGRRRASRAQCHRGRRGAGIRAVYRKLHLYDAFGQRESDWVAPGEIAPPETFEVDGLRFGLMTCYDLRFPEVARTLADAGWTWRSFLRSGCAAR